MLIADLKDIQKRMELFIIIEHYYIKINYIYIYDIRQGKFILWNRVRLFDGI